MTIQCPDCKSPKVHISRLFSLRDQLISCLGILAFRCDNCRRRFRARIWSFSEYRYARCPNCAGQVLRRWSTTNDEAGGWTRLLVQLGLQPYRCERCRLNFASLRTRMPKSQALAAAQERRMWNVKRRTPAQVHAEEHKAHADVQTVPADEQAGPAQLQPVHAHPQPVDPELQNGHAEEQKARSAGA